MILPPNNTLIKTADASFTLEKTRRCIDCDTFFVGVIGICPNCSEERLKIESESLAVSREQKRERIWRSICPESYRETDWSRPGISPVCAAIADQWTPGESSFEGVQNLNPGSSGSSLGMFGSTGCGKTRAAFTILRRHFDMGWRVFAIHASDAWDHGEHIQGLSSAVRLQYDDAQALREAATTCLRKAREAHLLLIDDMGKERANSAGTVTEAVGEAIYSLLEYRVACNMPTIWTCNMRAADLEHRLGQDRGAPTVRRLRDVSFLPEIL